MQTVVGNLIAAALTYELLYAIPAAIGLIPLLIRLRRQNGVTRLNQAAFALPALVWVLTALLTHREKSIANMIELIGLGLVVAVGALARFALVSRSRIPLTAGRLLAGACALGAVIAFVVPAIPE